MTPVPDPNMETTPAARLILNVVAFLMGRRIWFWYWDEAQNRYRLYLGRADR